MLLTVEGHYSLRPPPPLVVVGLLEGARPGAVELVSVPLHAHIGDIP